MSTAPPSSFNYASAAPSLKRTNSSSGPRPLHLLDLASLNGTSGTSSSGSSPATSTKHSTLFASPIKSPTPLSAPVDHSFGVPSQSRSATPGGTTSKRQSTISYFSPEHDSKERDYKRLSASSHSASLNRNGPESPFVEKGGTPEREKERERTVPITLAEKHAELLHFIAQKEAKCLELRSQLAGHEEELLQLKRKWERIVNRGVERDNLATSSQSHNYSNGSTLMSLASPTMALEGFKEGVQEMSRLLSAGLSSGGASRSGPSRSPSATSSPAAFSPKTLPRHAANDSNSSSSTSKTTATSSSKASHRLSQCSSATSYDGHEDQDDTVKGNAVSVSKNGGVHNSPQELIITDTGATPTVSPNPAFLEQKERRRRRKDKAEADKATTRKGDDNEDVWEMWGTEEVTGSQESLSSNSFLHSQTSSSSNISPRSSNPKIPTQSASRAVSLPVAQPPGYSTTSSIAGLSNLASQAHMSAWMGSVGKKLGELQNSTTMSNLSKSQKRASLIISDMSQSIASVLIDAPESRPLTRAGTPSQKSAQGMKGSSRTNSGSGLGRILVSSPVDDSPPVSGVISQEPRHRAPMSPSMAVMTPDVKVASSTSIESKSLAEKRRSRVVQAKKRDDGEGGDYDDDSWNW
ncbi:hypothetical protein FA15DRAFT_758526 [Coprinopsis marcescibilis]|uniref:Uncharacterized protein n=1 Tax=Coprinopsis marcescibilis TaxID=230819 RepID=A0A5C3KNT7_COPMA|nr:hypothetical protein FA15DRAFT_758526 [Coprinopsis marcescibilis]